MSTATPSAPSLPPSTPIVTLRHTLSAHTSDINGVAFGSAPDTSPDSASLLATSSSDKTVRLWSVDEDFAEMPGSPLVGHTYSVHGCTFGGEGGGGSVLATCSTDGRCILWDAKSGERRGVLEHRSKSSIRICRFNPAGDMIVTGSDDETLCIWNAASYKLIRSLEGHEASVVAAAFSPDGAFIVSGSTKGDLKVWDARYGHGKQLVFLLDAHDLGVTCAVFSPGYGSAGDVDLKVATQVNFLLATCGFDNMVKLWDVLAHSGTTHVELCLRDTLAGHTGPVMCCCFSPNGKILASSSGDKTVRLWNPLRGEPLFTIEAHSRFVTSVAFSRDASMLATGSNDKLVKIWTVTTQQQLSDATYEDVVMDLIDTSPGSSGRKPLQQWSVEEVVAWLEELGMSQYSGSFRAQAIDGEELQTLTHDTMLTALNIEALGHRNKLLRAIQNIHRHPVIQTQKSAPQASSSVKKPATVNPPADMLSNMPPDADEGVHDEYLCPITREIMKDPVIAADGYTYERAAIAGWMKSGKTRSPMTNAVLANSTLTPNRSLKMLIQRL